MNHQLDRLFSILSDGNFLSMQGLANEVPIFIQPYDVREEDQEVFHDPRLGATAPHIGDQGR